MATEQMNAPPPQVVYQQPQPQPAVQPVMVQQPAQQVILVKQEKPFPTFVENKYLMVFILLGAVFLLLGSIMVNVAPEITNKNYSGVSADAIASDQRAQKAMTDYGTVFKSIGVFFIFAFLLMAAILRTDLTDYTRFGMLLLLGLIMFATRFTLP